MIARCLSWCAAALFVVMLLAPSAARAEDKPKDLDKIPKAVMDTLKSKFAKAEITKWTKETENGTVVYDIEFTQEGRKCEMDIKEDGTIINIERAIEAKDLPEAVTKAIDKKYANSKLKEIMEIKAGKEEKLEGYEVVLETADKKSVEVTVAPDGKIVEDTGEKKEKK